MTEETTNKIPKTTREEEDEKWLRVYILKYYRENTYYHAKTIVQWRATFIRKSNEFHISAYVT